MLKNSQAAMFVDPTAARVVNEQAKEIEALKFQIQVLRRKGGKLYA
eukprot:jgi/Chlat1/7344/Chrsp59S06952